MKTMWKNTVEQGRLYMTIWRMLIACWTNKATHSLTVCQYYCFPTANSGCKNTLQCYVVRYVRYLTCLIFMYFKRNVTTATKYVCSGQSRLRVLYYGPKVIAHTRI